MVDAPRDASGGGYRPPVNTYRLQLHAGFRFDDAREAVPYLHELGITHVYLSPITDAITGSTHGYDVTDPSALNPDLGGEEAYGRLVEALRAHDMGVIADVVPNHMGIATDENAWWNDVLRRGPASEYAPVFDVDWEPPEPASRGRVLLPFLGDTLEAVLERGELELETGEDGLPWLRYYDRRFPLRPESLETIRASAVDDLDPVPEGNGPGQLGRQLAAQVRALNDRRRSLEGRERLRRIVEEQHYRLGYWRTAQRELNYRRFFTIDELLAVRASDPEVFPRLHALVLRLIEEGRLDGLRIDHPDGLEDPEGYLALMRDAIAKRIGDATDGDLPGRYVVLEKILEGEEELPEGWAAHGTSGYDFLNDLNAVFVDPDREAALTLVYARFTGHDEPYEAIARRSREEVLDGPIAHQVERAARDLHAAAAPDVDAEAFVAAVRALIAGFPVYRSYHRAGALDAAAPGVLDAALEAARTAALRAAGRATQANQDTLEAAAGLLARPAEGPARRAALRLQQLMPVVQAKGLEDRAFYRYNRLLSLNEVGGDPGRFGAPVARFHARNARRRERWPHAMLASATHDHKRGEDVRARLNVLAEIPEAFEALLERWSVPAGVQRLDGGPPVDARDAYLLYQTVLGVWPPGRVPPEERETLIERLEAFMTKALREGEELSSWLEPDEAYEGAVASLIRGALDGATGDPITAEAAGTRKLVARLGAVNALGQLTLKLASPGVVDTYQGTESWDLSLVDPDNRRPVDFEARAAALRDIARALDAHALEPLCNGWADGRLKLYLLTQGLRARRADPALYVDGDYVPLEVAGERAAHAVAFARTAGERAIIAVVARLPAALDGERREAPLWRPAWGDTSLALPEGLRGRWRDRYSDRAFDATDGVLSLGDALDVLPAALLEREA